MKELKNSIYLTWLSVLLLRTSALGLFRQSNVKYQEYSSDDVDDVVALILARGGSKGIPLKNLAKIGNDTLLGRTLKTVFQSQIFADVWVSTDHDKIADEAMKYNANVHIRPIHTADDKTASIESVQEFLNFHPEIRNLALIQCTSVFLKESYLQEAVQLFRNTQVDCVFSVTRNFKLRWSYDSKSEKLKPLNFHPERRPRRQDWDGELVETGMIYLARKFLLQNGAFQNGRCGFVEVHPDDELEIDSAAQLQLANVLVNLRENILNKN